MQNILNVILTKMYTYKITIPKSYRMAHISPIYILTSPVVNLSNSLLLRSSRPGRPPKRGPVGLSLPASHLSHHPQLKKHRLDNGDYPYENGHLNGKFV